MVFFSYVPQVEKSAQKRRKKLIGILYRYKNKVKTNYKNPMLESKPPKREIKQARARKNFTMA